jgi:prephenate dehydrogenase
MTTSTWNQVTVFGCGLIGASFALAVRRTGVATRILGWDSSPAVVGEAIRRGVIDDADRSFAEGEISSSDLIFLSVPVREIVAFLHDRSRQVKPGAVITDTGSTKIQIHQAASTGLSSDREFVGGHPVAGSHLTGMDNARADLFEGSSYVLTTGEGGNASPAMASVQKTMECLGARIQIMSPADHDHAMALISHLPQIASTALAAVISDQPNASALSTLSGQGFRDMTRLASSSWSMWRDILATNPANIAIALEIFIEKLQAVRDELRDSSAREGMEFPVTSKFFRGSAPA